MQLAALARPSTVAFWDGYAQWYKLWMEHNHYHDEIINILLTQTEPEWKVLDIGAGNGVLSLPLCAFGCDVIALEPSKGMRNLLQDHARPFFDGVHFHNNHFVVPSVAKITMHWWRRSDCVAADRHFDGKDLEYGLAKSTC